MDIRKELEEVMFERLAPAEFISEGRIDEAKAFKEILNIFDKGNAHLMSRMKAAMNLCDSCVHHQATCGGSPKYGNGVGNDNVYDCNLWQLDKKE